MKPGNMTRVINRKRYSTKTAELVASDVYWDSSNMERHGRNTWLWRTSNGAYFTTTRSMWQGGVPPHNSGYRKWYICLIKRVTERKEAI